MWVDGVNRDTIAHNGRDALIVVVLIPDTGAEADGVALAEAFDDADDWLTTPLKMAKRKEMKETQSI